MAQRSYGYIRVAGFATVCIVSWIINDSSALAHMPDDPKPDGPPPLDFKSTDKPDPSDKKDGDKKQKADRNGSKKGSDKKKNGSEGNGKTKESEKTGDKAKEGSESGKDKGKTKDQSSEDRTEPRDSGKNKTNGKDTPNTDKRPGSRTSAKPGKDEPFFYEYTVEKGDTPELVAKMYGVSVDRLRRWNKKAIPRKGAIPEGTVLKIYAVEPIRPKRKATYEVKKQEPVTKIAKRLKVPASDLKAFNGIKKDKVEAGTTLVYLTGPTASPSSSIGRCNSGRLENGEKLPAGPGYSYGSRPNVYGTNESVTTCLTVFSKFRKKHPRGPMIVVGNMSRSGGGHLSPHKSHQSGRDIDIGYMFKKDYQPVTHMMNANEKNMDAELTWELIDLFLKTGKVQNMFIDYEIQKILYEHLSKHGVKKSRLDKLFQYPKGKGTEAIIKHIPGHVHHIHIRFKCPKADKECID